MPQPNLSGLKLVLLDRDGVINQDSAEYIKSAAEFLPLEGSMGAIARLQSKFWIAVCTNQSGVGRGYFDETTLADIHDKLNANLVRSGGRAVDIYYCPHHPDEGCPCRKPNPGLLESAMQAVAATPAETLYVGDSVKDLLAAQQAGCLAGLVRTGNGAASALSQEAQHASLVTDNLVELAEILLNV